MFWANFSIFFRKYSGSFFLILSKVVVVRCLAVARLKGNLGLLSVNGRGSSIMLSGRILVPFRTLLRKAISSWV